MHLPPKSYLIVPVLSGSSRGGREKHTPQGEPVNDMPTEGIYLTFYGEIIMNEEARIIFEKIADEIREASIRYELSLSLFGSDENRLILFNAAPTVFYTFRSALIDATIMGICRICDPSQENRNLTIESLKNSLTITDSQLTTKLEQLEAAIKEQLEQLKPHRNKRIGHKDYETHLNDLMTPQGNNLGKVDSPAIDKSLKYLQEYLSAIRLHYDNQSVIILNPSYPSNDGPKRLLTLLRKAIDE